MGENFVLVHGAWHGGWAWQPVASRLRAAGHRVWAPTCPGLGVDDDPRGVTLAGCVDSLVSQVEASFAVDVTLVGHSWGGYVIAGAAPRLASRLKRLVFWSAFVPEAGKPLYDEVPPAYQELFASSAGASEDVALPPGEYGWSRFAERIKVSPVPVPGSHESMFTRPAELADALTQVATA